MPDIPFPKRVNPVPYHRPGTPYRKVDPPCKETLEVGIIAKNDDSFEIDSKSDRTLLEEPKEPKTPRFEMPEGITRRKLAPAVFLFVSDKGKGLKLKRDKGDSKYQEVRY